MQRTAVFTDYVPPAAVPYCEHLLRRYDFEFRVVASRRSRLGDFTSRPFGRPRITVNNDLNPYSFLITYLHEVAHCVVYRTCSYRVAPHGAEWKACFSQLLQPVLVPDILPPDLLETVSRYAAKPTATTSGYGPLFAVLKAHDTPQHLLNKKPLHYVNEGACFVFQGREFVKGTLRRTRVLCTDKRSRLRYTIPGHVLVEECS